MFETFFKEHLKLFKKTPERREIYGFYFSEVRGDKVCLLEVASNGKSGKIHVVVIGLINEEPFIRCITHEEDLEELPEIINREDVSTECIFRFKGKCPHTFWAANFFLTDKEALEKLEKELSGNTEFNVSLERLLELKRNVLIFGETGSGKTYEVLRVFKNLKRRGLYDSLVQIDFTSGLEDTDLLGRVIPLSPERKVREYLRLKEQFPDVREDVLVKSIGDWCIEEGELAKAFRLAREGNRVLVLLEEISRANPKTLNLLIKAMDGVRGVYRLHNFLTGETLTAKIENLVFVATANFGGGYSGTETLDEALLDRFGAVIYMGYNEKKERKILLNILGNGEIAEKLLHLAKSLRNAYLSGYLKSPFSTRMLVNTAKLIKEGFTEAEAFGTVAFRLVEKNEYGIPDEEQLKIVGEIFQEVFGTTPAGLP